MVETQLEEKKQEENNLKFTILILLGSLFISGILIYKILDNNIYKFGFITIENKPEFKFNDNINFFIVYDLNDTRNNNILGSESVKLWIFLLHNFKNPVYYSVGKECEIVYKNATSETKTREYCLNLAKNLEYSVVVLPDKKNYIKIDNKKKQFIIYINKENEDEIIKMFIFLKDLILGKFNFN